jgi:alkaline phosphatase D
MISPVVFPPLPADLTGALNDVTGLLPEDGVPYNVDQWDGYTADRRELIAHLRDHGVQNTVFLTGDIHSAWACDLPVDAGTYPASATAATEFVCTSVTSNNLDDITGSPPRTTSLAVEAGIQANNRHVRYLNFDDHGFSVLDVTARRTQMDYYVVDRTDPRSGATWTASWATAADTQRVHAVDRPVGGAR